MKLPPNEEHPDHHPATSNTSTAEKPSAAAFAIYRCTDNPSKDQTPEEREEQSCEQGNHQSERDQPVTYQEATASAQFRKSESCLSDEPNAPEPIADTNNQPSEQRPRANLGEVPVFPSIEASPNTEDRRSIDETPDIDDQKVIGETAIPDAHTTPKPGNDVQAGDVVPETKAVLAAVQHPGSELIQSTAGDHQEQYQPEEDEPVGSDAEKTPQRYRPPPQKPPGQTIKRHVNEDLKSRRARSRLTLAITFVLRLTVPAFATSRSYPNARPNWTVKSPLILQEHGSS
jgi:hypothetical protein